MWRLAALSILVLAMATGCIPAERRDFAVAAPPAAKAAPPEPPPPPTASPPLPERKPDSVATGSVARVDPKQIVGLGFRQTEDLLGLPAKQEEKPPAKVWIYSADGCELDIFFYADINTREFRALTYEIKDNQAMGGSNDRCLARLMRGT
jgi:hypothetical protein